MKRDNIDLVFVGGYHQEAGLILRQMRDQGIKTILMAGDAHERQEFRIHYRPLSPRAHCSPSARTRARSRQPR